MHMGAVSAELGLGGWPSLGESLGVARELSLAARHPAAAAPDAPLGARVGRAAARGAQAAGVAASGEVTPHHLCLTDEAVRSLDPNLKMNPPLRTEPTTARALIDALVDGTIEAIATDHAPHSREEKDVPFEAAPFGVTGLETAFAALYTHARRAGPASGSRRCSSGCRPARRASSGSSGRGSPSARRRTSSCSTRRRPGGCARTASARARRTRGCSAERLHGQGAADGRGRAGSRTRHRRRDGRGFLVLEDGTVFRGRERRRARASRSARPSSRRR